MEVTVHIPDYIATRMAAAGDDVSRRTLENFALEELRAKRITELELRKMLGLARIQLDGFLKSHGIHEDVSISDIEQDVADLKACLRA